MKKLLLIAFIVGCSTEPRGSDSTMDYNSLKGSGMSPQGYDALVKQRQLQYAEENKDEDA